jgi:thiamine biosynthesis lipoprotein
MLAAHGCRREPRVQPDPDHPGRYRSMFETMGTDGAILVVAPGPAEATEMVSAAIARIRAVERRMSTYRPNSEISQLNARGAVEPVNLSPLTLEVLKEAGRFHQITGGTFDPTYAPLRTLWRTAQERQEVPTDAEVEAALSRVGNDGLIIEDGAARFDTAGMEVDLGGIAKGFAIDRAIEALSESGALSALVDIGGDIRVLGRRGDNTKWKIQVRDPRPEKGDPIILRLENVAVATSGDYARFFRIGERRFSHIVDPRTGRPVHSVPSATIIAPDAVTADALATAASVLGAPRAVELVDSQLGVECMIVSRGETDEQKEKVYFSENFRSFIDSEPQANE